MPEFDTFRINWDLYARIKAIRENKILYLVTGSEFNQRWYPELIGKILTEPPAYAQVTEIKA